VRRLRALPVVLEESFKNLRNSGFWTSFPLRHASPNCYRVINNRQRDSTRPMLVIFKEMAPPSFGDPVPAHWVNGSGTVTLNVTNGTLMPVKETGFRGHPLPRASASVPACMRPQPAEPLKPDSHALRGESGPSSGFAVMSSSSPLMDANRSLMHFPTSLQTHALNHAWACPPTYIAPPLLPGSVFPDVVLPAAPVFPTYAPAFSASNSAFVTPRASPPTTADPCAAASPSAEPLKGSELRHEHCATLLVELATQRPRVDEHGGVKMHPVVVDARGMATASEEGVGRYSAFCQPNVNGKRPRTT